MTGCKRCGKCCELLAIGKVRGMLPDERRYLELHGAFFDKGFALIRSPCSMLAFHEMGIASCMAHDNKPTQCRQFKGKKLHDGRVSYVPDGCGYNDMA